MKNIMVIVAILMFVGCQEAEASKKNITNKIIIPENKAGNFAKYTEDIIYTQVVEINLDDMTFADAFALEHRAKGEGKLFWWRGNQYTTNIAVLDEFVISHLDSNKEHLSWVTNNDDPDDTCRSNKLDDCGKCDGPGKITWFLDKDGDGLGAFAEWVTSCTYPTATEIEKFQAESLLEGGGDQGY